MEEYEVDGVALDLRCADHYCVLLRRLTAVRLSGGIFSSLRMEMVHIIVF